MATKRNGARSIISAEGGAAAAPANRRRTTHKRATQPAVSTQDTTVEASYVEEAQPETGISDHDAIARLAYSYWESRGYQPGSPEEDWLRAEQEIRGRAATAAQ